MARATKFHSPIRFLGAVVGLLLTSALAPAAAQAVSFSGPTNFPAGSGPNSIASGDFNGDGKRDLVMADSASGAVVLLGNGDGTFSAPTSFPSGTNSYGVAVGDFNGDSHQDLAITDQTTPGAVSILLGNGAGAFSAPTSFGAGVGNPHSVVIGDFNGDSRKDLAIANGSSQGVSILLGNGIGGFTGPTNFSAGFPGGGNPIGIAAADFNNDGRLDVAVTNGNGSTLAILLGNGAGALSAPTQVTVGTGPIGIVAGDFNGDAKADLAVANRQSDTVSVLLGNGTGGFSAPTTISGTGIESVAVGDFDLDSHQDLASTGISGANTNVSVLLGDGNGGFSGPTTLSAGTGSFPAVVAGDFNGDALPDLAVSNDGSHNVSILLNTTGAYARPRGATPLRASLVPAYQQCTVPNETHGAPLSFGSCNPPVAASPNLTVGTPDANGAAANGSGVVLLRAGAADISINVATTDVRCEPGVSACGAANSADGPDYTGQVQASAQLRITDRLNGPSQTLPATVSDTSFPVTVPCTATASTAAGATCSISTSANAVVPGSVQAGKRAIWQLDRLQLFDGGPDGVVSTANNSLFEEQGVFVP